MKRLASISSWYPISSKRFPAILTKSPLMDEHRRVFILENSVNAEKSKMKVDFLGGLWHNHFRKLRKLGKI